MIRRKELHWTSTYYRSHERCVFSKHDQQFEINSVISGSHQSVPYHVAYVLCTSLDWKVKSLELTYSVKGTTHTVSALRQDNDWIVNGQVRKEFATCIDVDISVTPFTNSLPINRLNLECNKPQPIEVLYIDVLENSIRAARQRYIRKSDTVYTFETVPNDFEADIIVDTEGFVVHYPELFDRVEE